MQVTPIFRTVATAQGAQENLFLLGFRMNSGDTSAASCEEDEMEWKVYLQLSSWCKLVLGARTVQGKKFGSRDHFLPAASNAPLSNLLHSTICPRNSIGPQLFERSSFIPNALFSAEVRFPAFHVT